MPSVALPGGSRVRAQAGKAEPPRAQTLPNLRNNKREQSTVAYNKVRYPALKLWK